MCGSQQHAVAGLAQSEHGDPAIDPGGLDPGINLGRDKRQPGADEDALDHIIPHSSYLGKGEQTDEEKDANRPDDCRPVSHYSAHIFILTLWPGKLSCL